MRHWKWLVDFNAGETQLVSFDWSNNTGGIDVTIDGSVLEEKSSFKMMQLCLSFKLDWVSNIISIAFKEIEALIRSMKFFLLRLLCVSVNLLYGLAWFAVVISGLVLLTATWKC